MKVKSESEVTQSCPTLRDPTDCSLPGSSVDGTFQARVLEWVAIALSDIIYISIYKRFSITFDKCLRKNIPPQKKEEMEKLENIN